MNDRQKTSIRWFSSDPDLAVACRDFPSSPTKQSGKTNDTQQMNDLMFHVQLDFMAKGFARLFPEDGGVTSVFSTHPGAPHLRICRNKSIMKQTVPVLLARNHGGSDAQARLGNRFYAEAPGWFPMFHLYAVPTRSGEQMCIFFPFLFDRAPRDGDTFLGKVIEICRRLDRDQTLSAWYVFGCIGMEIQTPDGPIHRPEDYPDAPSGLTPPENSQADGKWNAR